MCCRLQQGTTWAQTCDYQDNDGGNKVLASVQWIEYSTRWVTCQGINNLKRLGMKEILLADWSTGACSLPRILDASRNNEDIWREENDTRQYRLVHICSFPPRGRHLPSIATHAINRIISVSFIPSIYTVFCLKFDLDVNSVCNFVCLSFDFDLWAVYNNVCIVTEMNRYFVDTYGNPIAQSVKKNILLDSKYILKNTTDCAWDTSDRFVDFVMLLVTRN